ncbi:MAG: 2-C-methyl-D-erythritol 2,4-cyclodiphosphate synthase [Candidatus Dormibacteraeota bacterium]|nr:2-C-methyl-D-erythritol 2,4-cyclodiphosphate synthase [Candidatus Dormibacteraeota bacterium]
MTLRIGHGMDAHRLVAGRPLMLGCVNVPHERGLAGHSDGDAVVHALCDALLGAAGQGDMGRHFPSADERWRDATGAEFLRAVADLLSERSARLVSAQVVAIAEEPRLAAHLGAMSAACAAALGVDGALLRVTATSSDGLGFTGRGEGIGASAVVLLDVGA